MEYKIGDIIRRDKIGLKGRQLVKLSKCSVCEVIKWANPKHIEPYMCNKCTARERAKKIDLNSFIHKENCKCHRCRIGKGYFLGDKNPMWNGGRKVLKSGYIYVWIGPNNEFSSMCSKYDKNSHYVMEHRLVMAKHIGRPLTKKETVHHLNGIRDDNRIENLELWSSNHQSGQRIKDQIKNAIELLTKQGFNIEKHGKSINSI